MYKAKDFREKKATGYVILGTNDNSWLRTSISTSPEELEQELKDDLKDIEFDKINDEIEAEAVRVVLTVAISPKIELEF
jgi:hypothetical protein